MAKKHRILFIYPFLSSFIEKDLKILQEEFDVIPFLWRGKKDIFGLLRGITKTDLNVSWFVMGHATTAAFLSRILGKKSILIAGGWDVVSMPEINYGAMIGKKRQKKTRYALKRAKSIIAVSKSTKSWTQKWINRNDINMVYHGFDPNKFTAAGDKENMVVTVGTLTNDVTIKIKGLKAFVETAKLLPDIKFIIIGKHDKKIASKWRNEAPDNLEIIDFLRTDELLKYYQRAKIYAQLSYQESFGCAMAEAMLCECVPVVTRRGALPEVVGDSGFYVKYDDVQGIKRTILKAVNSNRGGEARDRIIKEFPLSKRRNELINIIYESLM
jgi:glycosyltransferase involved in cell wall biosynthesis